MPIFDNNLKNHKIAGSNYGFSAKRIADLGAAEYTLVVLTADHSGSVHSFRAQIERCITQVVRACRHSPRVDNLMLRATKFSDKLTEIHGFKPLSDCQEKDYKGCLKTGGLTSLYDAAHNGAESIINYGSRLTQSDFDVNGILFVITDGMDNRSSQTPKSVKAALERALTGEHLESMLSVLIGVNVADKSVSKYLKKFSKTAGFNNSIELTSATEKTLTKLAEFVSQSISLQSRSLGQGTAPSLSF